MIQQDIVSVHLSFTLRKRCADFNEVMRDKHYYDHDRHVRVCSRIEAVSEQGRGERSFMSSGDTHPREVTAVILRGIASPEVLALCSPPLLMPGAAPYDPTVCLNLSCKCA